MKMKMMIVVVHFFKGDGSQTKYSHTWLNNSNWIITTAAAAQYTIQFSPQLFLFQCILSPRYNLLSIHLIYNSIHLLCVCVSVNILHQVYCWLDGSNGCHWLSDINEDIVRCLGENVFWPVYSVCNLEKETKIMMRGG